MKMTTNPLSTPSSKERGFQAQPIFKSTRKVVGGSDLTNCSIVRLIGERQPKPAVFPKAEWFTSRVMLLSGKINFYTAYSSPGELSSQGETTLLPGSNSTDYQIVKDPSRETEKADVLVVSFNPSASICKVVDFSLLTEGVEEGDSDDSGIIIDHSKKVIPEDKTLVTVLLSPWGEVRVEADGSKSTLSESSVLHISHTTEDENRKISISTGKVVCLSILINK